MIILQPYPCQLGAFPSWLSEPSLRKSGTLWLISVTGPLVSLSLNSFDRVRNRLASSPRRFRIESSFNSLLSLRTLKWKLISFAVIVRVMDATSTGDEGQFAADAFVLIDRGEAT